MIGQTQRNHRDRSRIRRKYADKMSTSIIQSVYGIRREVFRDITDTATIGLFTLVWEESKVPLLPRANYKEIQMISGPHLQVICSSASGYAIASLRSPYLHRSNLVSPLLYWMLLSYTRSTTVEFLKNKGGFAKLGIKMHCSAQIIQKNPAQINGIKRTNRHRWAPICHQLQNRIVNIQAE